MNITFFFGNGFDLSVGLKTRYSDFIEAYMRTPCNGNVLAECKRLLHRTMCKAADTWADLEEALCALSAEFTPDHTGMNHFFDLHGDLTLQLQLYLQSEITRIKPSDYKKEIIRGFEAAICDPCASLAPVFRNRVLQACNRHPSPPNHHRFVCFNYTSVFDDCLSIAAASPKLRKIDLLGSDSAHPLSVLHIHGHLDGTVLLGSDNVDQLLNTFHNRTAIERGFAKPAINDALGTDFNPTLRKIIESSHLIVVYGLSLGKTDLTWWREIGRWLHGDADRHVVLHTYGISNADTIPKVQIDAVQSTQDKMLAYMALDYPGTNLEPYRAQIQVLVNQDFFPARLV